MSAALAAALALPTIHKATCVTLDFPGGAVRLWDGFGPLVAGGYTWRGASALVNYRDLAAASVGASNRLKLGLSAVDEDLVAPAWAAYEEGEILGTLVTLDFCFFDADARPVEPLFRQLAGEIVKFSDDPSEPDQKTGETTHTFTVEVTDEFGLRSSAPHAYLSQQWLASIDDEAAGLALVPTLFDVTINFPDFR